MPRIGRVYRMQTLPCQIVTEAMCARTCNRAEAPDRRRLEAPTPNPEANEWATGRLRRAQRRRTAVRSAVFGRAARRGCKATTDIRASGPPGAAAEAPRVGAECRAEVVAAGAAATAVADIDRSENNHGENQFY